MIELNLWGKTCSVTVRDAPQGSPGLCVLKLTDSRGAVELSLYEEDVVRLLIELNLRLQQFRSGELPL